MTREGQEQEEIARLSHIMNGRLARRRNWSLAAGFCVAFAVFAANAGRILVVDAPERSDVILVLAGETDRRPARALELLSQGYGQRVVMDVPLGARVYDFTEVELAEKYVQNLPTWFASAPLQDFQPGTKLATRRSAWLARAGTEFSSSLPISTPAAH